MSSISVQTPVWVPCHWWLHPVVQLPYSETDPLRHHLGPLCDGMRGNLHPLHHLLHHWRDLGDQEAQAQVLQELLEHSGHHSHFPWICGYCVQCVPHHYCKWLAERPFGEQQAVRKLWFSGILADPVQQHGCCGGVFRLDQGDISWINLPSSLFFLCTCGLVAKTYIQLGEGLLFVSHFNSTLSLFSFNLETIVNHSSFALVVLLTMYVGLFYNHWFYLGGKCSKLIRIQWNVMHLIPGMKQTMISLSLFDC